MAATTVAYWPGISEEQIESQPPFHDDGYAWGEWRAALDGEPDVVQSLFDLDAGALLTVMTEGMRDEDVRWVTPRELREAARKLRYAVTNRSPGTKRILEVYSRHAPGEATASEDFLAGLAELEDIALWAEHEGTNRVTLEVNW